MKARITVPVILVGGLRSRDTMAEIIGDGAADLVAMSRPLIGESGLIQRWKNGDRE